MFEWSYWTWQNAAWLNLTEIIFKLFATTIVKYDKIDEVIYPDGTLFLRFVSDNTDHDMETIDGKNTHHGLGSLLLIMIHLLISWSVEKEFSRTREKHSAKYILMRGSRSFTTLLQIFNHYQELWFANQTGNIKSCVKFNLAWCSDWSTYIYIYIFFFAKGSLIVSDIVCTLQLIHHWVFSSTWTVPQILHTSMVGKFNIASQYDLQLNKTHLLYLAKYLLIYYQGNIFWFININWYQPCIE